MEEEVEKGDFSMLESERMIYGTPYEIEDGVVGM